MRTIGPLQAVVLYGLYVCSPICVWSQNPCDQSAPSNGCPTLNPQTASDGLQIAPMSPTATVTVDIGGLMASDQSSTGSTAILANNFSEFTQTMPGYSQMTFNVNAGVTGVVPVDSNGNPPTNPATLGGTVQNPVIMIYSGNVTTLGGRCTATTLACTVSAYDTSSGTPILTASITVYSNSIYSSGVPAWATPSEMAPLSAHDDVGHAVLAFGDVTDPTAANASNSLMDNEITPDSPTTVQFCDMQTTFQNDGGSAGCDPCDTNPASCDPCLNDTCYLPTCDGYDTCTCDPTDPSCFDNYCDDDCDPECGDPCDPECEGSPDYEDSDCDGRNIKIPVIRGVTPYLPTGIAFASVLPFVIRVRRRKPETEERGQ